MSETLDLLLKSDITNIREKKIKVKRLSTKEKPFILTLRSLNYNKAVSYTHLDVYKRQTNHRDD